MSEKAVLGPAASAPVGARRGFAAASEQQQSLGGLMNEMASLLSSCDDPIHEARELVASLLDVPRHWPLMHEAELADPEVVARAMAAAERRACGAPLAYAAGRANFRALTLAVDERVLIPRPETELLVDLVLDRVQLPAGTAIDVGTGSGAIAIALASEGNFERVLATDVSTDALDLARANASAHGARVEFSFGDLVGPYAATRPSVIVSNPPYVSFDEVEALPGSVRDWEPVVALLSGDNGLATTARLVRKAAGVLETGGLLAVEVDCRRASLVAELMAANRFADVNVHLDLAGRERFVLATRKE